MNNAVYRSRWWSHGLWLSLVLLLSACVSAGPAPTPSLPPRPTPTLQPTAVRPPPAAPTATPVPPTFASRIASPSVPPAAPTATLPPAATPPTGATASPVARGEVAVTIVDFDFVPKVITVPVGTRIVWTNAGPTIHTVADRALTLFGSDILNKGDRFSWTPPQAGTIPYWCTIHPDMVGTIVVTP